MLRKQYLMVHPKTKRREYVPKRQIQFLLKQGYHHYVDKTNRTQYTESFDWTDIIWGRKTWSNVHIKNSFIPNLTFISKILFKLILWSPISFVVTWGLVNVLLMN